MPRGDGTGPAGQGSKTGRGEGLCAGNEGPGYMNPVGRGGFIGRVRGIFGRGNRNSGEGNQSGGSVPGKGQGRRSN